MTEAKLTPFEEAEFKLSAFAENMARSEAVNTLVRDLLEEERACSLPISGSVGVSFESEHYQAAISTLRIVCAMGCHHGHLSVTAVISEAIRELTDEVIVLQANPPPRPGTPSGLVEWREYRKVEEEWKLKVADMWGRIDALRSIQDYGSA